MLAFLIGLISFGGALTLALAAGAALPLALSFAFLIEVIAFGLVIGAMVAAQMLRTRGKS